VTEQLDFIGGGGTIRGGYAGMPGRGPIGERCGTCAHCTYERRRNPRRWYKCSLGSLSHSEASDIRLKTAACQYWERDE